MPNKSEVTGERTGYLADVAPSEELLDGPDWQVVVDHRTGIAVSMFLKGQSQIPRLALEAYFADGGEL